ncbi:MAG: transposase [Marinicaulis sp.]|nr:transposase [Marinicaulis sp.]
MSSNPCRLFLGGLSDSVLQAFTIARDMPLVWLVSLDRSKLEDWRRDYNEIRPYSAIRYKTPITLINPTTDNHPP